MSPDPAAEVVAPPRSKSLFEEQPRVAEVFTPDAATEFQYQPVPPLAPITLFLGLCSVAGFLGLPAMGIGIIGILCGSLGLWQIRRADGALGGKWLTRIGLALSLLLTVGAGALHAYVYATEVPEGHQRLSFAWLSQREPKLSESDIEVPPEVHDLNDKPVFIKGYMYPTRVREGLSEFVLVKDNGDCCFGKQPKLSDMIVVHMQEGQTVNFREAQLVSVAGTFKIAGVHQAGDIVGLYTIDGTHFR